MMKRSVSALKLLLAICGSCLCPRQQDSKARLLVVIFRVSLQVIHVEELDDLSSWGVI